MKLRNKIYVLGTFLIGSTLLSQENLNKNWSFETANTLPKGRIEFGVFQQASYGFSENTEFYSRPIVFFIMPNFGIKQNWISRAHWQFSSSHALSIPTFLLKAISKDGTGGLLPKDTDIPFILSSQNEVLFTYSEQADYSLTARAGFSFSLAGESDHFPTIDYHLLYTRSADYHAKPTYFIGLSLNGNIWEKFSSVIDIDVYKLTLDNGYMVIEHKFLIAYEFSNTKKLHLGYKYSMVNFHILKI